MRVLSNPTVKMVGASFYVHTVYIKHVYMIMMLLDFELRPHDILLLLNHLYTNQVDAAPRR